MKDPLTNIKNLLDATVYKDSHFGAGNKNAVFRKIHKPKRIHFLPALVGGLLITVLASVGVYFASGKLGGGEGPIASPSDNPITGEIPPSQGQIGTPPAPLYAAKDEDELSIEDAETAVELSVDALTDYYKAVWNGTEIDLDRYIGNENLKQFMETKLQTEYKKYGTLDSKVKELEIGDWEAKFTEDENGGYLYVQVPVDIQKHYGGGYGEEIEFFIRNINGEMAIVDWYTGGKDTYDYLVRGYEQTIGNPAIWNDDEWVKKFKSPTGLYHFEQQVYDRFQLTHDVNELAGLDPISIAKMYAYASYHEDFDAVYALYTDREDHILWSKEEDQEIPLADRTKENILGIFKNLEKGTFVQTGDDEGYIEFYPNGDASEKSGFSMIRNEDGIWQAAFLPVQ